GMGAQRRRRDAGAGRGPRDLLRSVTRLKQLSGLERTHEGKRAATATERCPLKDGLAKKYPFSKGRNDAKKEGWRNRNQRLRAARCARCRAWHGASGEVTGCHDALSEHGPDRAVSHGPNCRDRAGTKCSTGVHFTRCHGSRPWPAWLRNRGGRQEWLGVQGGTWMGSSFRLARILEPESSSRGMPQST